MSEQPDLPCQCQNRRFWQACFDAVPLQLCVLNANGDICHVNQAWQKACHEVWQFANALTVGQNFLRNLAASDKCANTIALLADGIHAVQNGASRLNTLEFAEHRADSVRWFRMRISAVPNEGASPAHHMPQHVLLCLDEITTRKLEQEALQTAGLVYQHSDEAILVTDANNNILAVNPGYTQLTGYTMQDVIGKNPNFSRSGRHDADFYRLMWHSLKTNGSWQGEIWNRKKDGSEIAEWITINAISDQQGKIVRHVALFSDITAQKLAHETHWRQANFDALCNLPNRRLMMDRLDTELKKAHRNQRMVALLFIDLDHFKEVNDKLGHAMGDLLLIETAHRLSACVRESDTVARLGGDEFIIMMGDFIDAEHVEQVARTILQSLAKPYVLGQQQASISCSIGVAIFPQDARNSVELIEHADQAMYQAKHGGKNRFCYFGAAAPHAPPATPA